MDDYRNRKKVELAVEIPNTYDEVVELIKRELDCPLPIREGERYHHLKYKLNNLWRDIVSDYSIDNEWHHVYDEDEDRDFELADDFLEELRPIAVNLMTWIEDAREEFLEFTKPIQTLVADETIYDKHILRKNLSLEEIKKLALKTDTSFLFSEITPTVLTKIIDTAVEKFFEPIVNSDKIRFSVICDREIGVTNKGIETKCLMIEIDCIQAIAHAYPCSDIEARNNVQTYSMLNAERYDYFEFEDGEPNLELQIKLSTDYSFND